MSDIHDRLKQLEKKLAQLQSQQKAFSYQIEMLQKEIYGLIRENEQVETEGEKEPKKIVHPQKTIPEEKPVEKIEGTNIAVEPRPLQEKQERTKVSGGLEKFIGENLMNKIGILILIIGIGIGAKYSIDNNLISPLTRIILGYIAGIGLMGVGFKLKTKYENYSAVLVSGAIATFYFITFFAYNLYSLYPQWLAFALMVIFTLFTVIASLNYNKQIIALLGLVGGYGIPFLLGDESGNITMLLSYIAVLNIGVMLLAFKKYWKILYYSAFVLTWFIFLFWFTMGYRYEDHFVIANVFSILFFLQFYITFLAYKLIKKEVYAITDIIIVLLNSFLYFGIGLVLWDQTDYNDYALGLFTLLNAIIHFIVGLLIKRRDLADKKLFYLVITLVIVFITIAFPIQLDGVWVTLLWMVMTAILFWVGRSKKITFYEVFSYAILLLAMGSLTVDWFFVHGFKSIESFVPIWNETFLTSVACILCLSFMLNTQKKYTSLLNEKWFHWMISLLIPLALLYTLYFTFLLEINSYFKHLVHDSGIEVEEDGLRTMYFDWDFRQFRLVWSSMYTLLFASLLAFLNLFKFKLQKYSIAVVAILIIAIVGFFMHALPAMITLNENYVDPDFPEYFDVSPFYIVIRYVAIAFYALAMYALYKTIKFYFSTKNYKILFDIFLHLGILILLSYELMNWMLVLAPAYSVKLGLSILWGIYALSLIAAGIWKNQMHLRWSGMILFGITLTKLVFYDLAHLNTISKTIVFVSLGVFLLLISYLYNRFKHIISDEDQD